MRSFLTHLECPWSGETYSADRLMNLSPAAGRPLLARYDLDAARSAFPRDSLKGRVASLWRYEEMLPVRDAQYRLTLGEGMTPLLHLKNLGRALGLEHLYGKDEGQNPTGSFKARGLAMAVARAAELGAKALAIPTAGNAGSAMAAYAALAQLPAYVYAPRDMPETFAAEMKALGAEVTLVDGLINDCAKHVRAGAEEGRWFDLSTLKEPYRVEGKKTMGYELAEQFDWSPPDVILYPTGGGTGIVGMWKAFDEMEKLGWIGSARPRLVSVQSDGCAPIVRAFLQGARTAEPWANAATIADGIRVPVAIGDFLVLEALRASDGTAVAAPDERILQGVHELARSEGVFASPECGAVIAALHELTAKSWIKPHERVVLFLTGSGLKYTHLIH